MESRLDMENIITLSCTEEEKQILTDVFAQHGQSIEQAVNEFLRWVIREPDTAMQQLKCAMEEDLTDENAEDEEYLKYHYPDYLSHKSVYSQDPAVDQKIRRTQALDMHAEGIPVVDIAVCVGERPATIRSWIAEEKECSSSEQ